VGQRLLEEYATNKSGTLTREEFMVLADLIMRHYEEGYARTVPPPREAVPKAASLTRACVP
jgi:hypothetical protein